MKTLIIVVACIISTVCTMPASPSAPRNLTPNDLMYNAVVRRAEMAVNDQNKNDLYLMKVTNVNSVVLSLDTPASKIYDVEFEVAHTNSPKGTDMDDVTVPSVG